MTLEPRLKDDRRHSVVEDMIDAEPPKNVLAASRELVDRLRGPEGLERYGSPYLAGLAAAAQFEPKLNRDLLADSYARLAIAEQGQPQPDAFARDSARLLVNFTRVREAFLDEQNKRPSENLDRYNMADESFPDEPLQGTRLSLIIASDRMISQEEAISLDRRVRHEADEDAFVRPRASDLAQAEYLFDIINGHREAFEDPILSQTIDRDADIIGSSVYLWKNREVFEPPFDKTDMVEVMSHAIAAREAGQKANEEEVLQGMSFDLNLRGEAKTLLRAIEDPKTAPNMGVLDQAVHADEETIRFFRAMEIGRFDKLDAIDTKMIRIQREDISNMPAKIAEKYPLVPAYSEALRHRLHSEGSLASVFPPQPSAGQAVEPALGLAVEALKADAATLSNVQAALAARGGSGVS